MNSNLNCLVSNCAYNKTGYCYASHIKVEGFEATVTPETYCESFINKAEANFTNSVSDDTLTNTQSISCSAKNCTYNFYGGCNADHVLISTRDSKCDTFRIKN